MGPHNGALFLSRAGVLQQGRGGPEWAPQTHPLFPTGPHREKPQREGEGAEFHANAPG